MRKNEVKRAKQMAAEATEAYLLRSSISFLECAIHLMATHISVDEIAEILEEEARQLREFG
jgi:predicted HTH domain antitoxin